MKAHSNRIFLLDEFESSVYYKHLPKLWPIFAELCEKNNNQIFAATHSVDALHSLGEALETKPDLPVTVHTLRRKEDDENTVDLPHRRRNFAESGSRVGFAMSEEYDIHYAKPKSKRPRNDSIGTLLLCEGVDDIYFLDKCLYDLFGDKREDIQIIDIGGHECTQISDAVQNIIDNFVKVKRILLFLDADEVPDNRYSNTIKTVDEMKDTLNGVHMVYFQIPAKDQPGSIETLILQTAANEHQRKYYELSEEATQKAFTFWKKNNLREKETTNNKDKRKIQCYLSLHHDKMYYGPGRAFAERRFGSIHDTPYRKR